VLYLHQRTGSDLLRHLHKLSVGKTAFFTACVPPSINDSYGTALEECAAPEGDSQAQRENSEAKGFLPKLSVHQCVST